MTLDALNVAGQATFVAALESIFESSPWVALRTWPERPFANVEALYSAMCAQVAVATPDLQLALIRAHPDLAGRITDRKTFSASSASEQVAAGLDRLAPHDAALFDRLNAAYTARFDFPFIICVRENTVATIVAGLRARLSNDRQTEITLALGEIEKIARLRLTDAVAA